jgi:hypothetical protein
MSPWRDDLSELEKNLNGPVFTVDTAGYEGEVAMFNLAVVHRPVVAVGAADMADVSEAVKFASRHGLNIAVLNTGLGPSRQPVLTR